MWLASSHTTDRCRVLETSLGLFFKWSFYFLLLSFVFISIWLHWVFTAVRGLSPVVASQGLLCVAVCWLLLPGRLSWGPSSRNTGPVAVAHGCLVARRHGTLPRPGSGPVSLALAGRFLTTAPLGKPWKRLSWYPFCFLLSSYTEHLICFEHPGEIFPALLASITAILLMSIFWFTFQFWFIPFMSSLPLTPSHI